MSAAALHLYRSALQTARTFQVPRLRPKLVYNVKELFQAYKAERDPHKIELLISQGQHDVQVLKGFARLEPATLETLFRSTIGKK